jgi:hypothetical protein
MPRLSEVHVGRAMAIILMALAFFSIPVAAGAQAVLRGGRIVELTGIVP